MACDAVLCGLACACVRGPSLVSPLPGQARLPTGESSPPRTRGNRPPWRLRHEAELAARARAEAELAARAEAEVEEWLSRDPEELAAAADALVWQEDFAAFVRGGWHVLEPATPLDWNWHHQLICCVLQALFETWVRAGRDPAPLPPILNTVFSVAPGSLKSRIIMVFFPAWVWLRAPSAKFICLSVNEDATLRDARAARDLMRSDWYQRAFAPAWTLKGDQDAVSNYANTAGGERLSKPSGSAIVGLRGDFVLYDDPNSPDENQSEREEINKVWDASIYSRVNSGQRSMRVGVQQRTGVGDWTDHVVEVQGPWSPTNREGWLRVVIPAEFDPARRFAMPEPLADVLRELLPESELVLEDPRTREGESVHPSRMPESFLAGERRRWEGTANYSAQYQQQPVGAGGGVVKRDYLRFFTLDQGVRADHDDRAFTRPRPAFCRPDPALLVRGAHHRPGRWDFDWVALSLDCAAKKTERGSRWGMVAAAGRGGRRFVLEDRTRRGDILEILAELRDMVRYWEPDRILVEDKAAGPDLLVRLREAVAEGDLRGVVLEEVSVGTQGKGARMDACLPTIANGMLYLLDGADWLEAFVDELCAFPLGRNDDRVDALTMVLNYYGRAEESTLPEW